MSKKRDYNRDDWGDKAYCIYCRNLYYPQHMHRHQMTDQCRGVQLLIWEDYYMAGDSYHAMWGKAAIFPKARNTPRIPSFFHTPIPRQLLPFQTALLDGFSRDPTWKEVCERRGYKSTVDHIPSVVCKPWDTLWRKGYNDVETQKRVITEYLISGGKHVDYLNFSKWKKQLFPRELVTRWRQTMPYAGPAAEVLYKLPAGKELPAVCPRTGSY